MKFRGVALFLIGFYVLFNITAYGEDDYFLKLDQLLIESSNKVELKYEDLSENIRIISSIFIKENNIKTLSDLIPYISAMFLSRYRSGESQIFTQGILNSHNERFLLLINGIPVYDPFYNKSVIDEYYPLDNVDHIEIAPGPYSSLYGTGTYAGFINIVEKEVFPNSLKIGAATTEYFRSAYSFAGSTDRFRYWASFTDLSDKGIGIDKTYKDVPNVLEEDPKENKFFRAGFATDHFKLSVMSINYRFKELNQDLYTWAQALQDDIGWHIFKDLLVTAEADVPINSVLNAEFDVSHQKFSRNSLWGYTVYNSTDAVYYYLNDAQKESSRSFCDLRLHSEIKYVSTLLGFYYEYNNLADIKDYIFEDNSSEYKEPSTYYVDPQVFSNYAAYVQMMLKNFSNIHFVGSFRYDYNYFFKDFISPKVTFSYNMKPFTFYVNTGRAFRSPSPRELLTKTEDWAEGNEDLTPEIIDSTSVSLRMTTSKFLFEAQTFYMELSDLIEMRKVDIDHSKYINVGKVFSKGITLIAEYQSRKLDTSLSMTYTDARVDGLLQYGYPLFKGVHLLKFVVTPEISFSMANTYVGRRPRSSWNPDKADGDPYLVTDLNLLFNHGNINFSLYAKNAFDVPYYSMYYVDKVDSSSYVEDLKMPGTVVGAELRYEF